MKRVNVKNGSVDSIELNITDLSTQQGSYVVADDVEVYGRWSHSVVGGVDVFTAPEPEPINPLEEPLNQVQFFTLLEFAFGKNEQDVVAIIESTITDPMQRIAAKNKFLKSDRYHRDNPLFALLAPVLSITDEQIDAAWAQALAIE